MRRGFTLIELPAVRKGKCEAFTLIELLVVVTIIALLLAIGAPAMTRALALTNINRCASNMHQFAVASTAYSTHNNGRFAGPNWGGLTQGFATHLKGWLYSGNQASQLEHLKTGLLWPYIGSYEVYRCPIDPSNPTNVPNPTCNTRTITSYCTNGSVCGYGHFTLSKGDSGLNEYMDTWRLIDFYPTDIIMWEPDETKGGGWWWDGSNYPHEGITWRHLDRGMVTCADGHAEWLLREDYYDLCTSGRTRLWNWPGSVSGH